MSHNKVSTTSNVNQLEQKDKVASYKSHLNKFSWDITEVLKSNTQEFLKKFFFPITKNLRVPGYYFDSDMIEKLFSNEWITMIDFKKTLYHKWEFLWKEWNILDETSYGENEKHNYKAKINESSKSIEIYIDWWINWEPNNSIKYDGKPDEDGFNILKRLNTLYKQNKDYEYACTQLWASHRLLLHFNDPEMEEKQNKNIEKNMNTLKKLDHTILMKNDKYKDFMLQLIEFTDLGKYNVSLLYQCMSKEYLDWTIEKKREMDELAKKKIKLFKNFPEHGTYFWAWVYDEIRWVRPYIALKYLELKAKRSGDYTLEFCAWYIGSIEPQDMDPNDERIKDVNLGWWYIVAKFMSD